MKTVVVIYNLDDWNRKKPFKKSKLDYESCWKQFYELGKKQNLNFSRAYINWYIGKGKFKKAWTYDIKLKRWKKIYNVKADFVFDKVPSDEEFKKIKYKIHKEVGMMNHPEMDYITNDKSKIKKLFSKIIPKTFVIKNKKELKNSLKKIDTKKAVIKPSVGSGGQGIAIKEKNKLLNYKIKKGETYVLQEFIDTSNGIKNLVKQTHDLRVIVVNGKIIYSYLRIPKKGKFLCNIHQGGKMITIKNNQIPKKIKSMIKSIDKKLKKYKPRNYAADFFIGKNQKPYLIEINTKPGILFNKEDEKLKIKYYNKLIKILKK